MRSQLFSGGSGDSAAAENAQLFTNGAISARYNPNFYESMRGNSTPQNNVFTDSFHQGKRGGDIPIHPKNPIAQMMIPVLNTATVK